MTAPDRRPERTVDLSLYLLRAIVPEGLGPDRAADIMDRDIDAPMPLDHIPVKRTGAVSFLKVVNFTISVEPVGTKARKGRHRGVRGEVRAEGESGVEEKSVSVRRGHGGGRS